MPSCIAVEKGREERLIPLPAIFQRVEAELQGDVFLIPLRKFRIAGHGRNSYYPEVFHFGRSTGNAGLGARPLQKGILAVGGNCKTYIEMEHIFKG